MPGTPVPERVVVLDGEILSALGVGTTQVWNSLLEDHLPAGRVTRFDASALPVDAAAEVPDYGWDLANWPDRVRAAADFDRKLELMLGCAGMAMDRLRRLVDTAEPGRRGIAVGVGLDVSPVEKVVTALREDGHPAADLQAVSALNLQADPPGRLFNPTDLVTMVLAEALECRAFQDSVLTACSSSSQALALGVEAIRRGDADMVVVGGTDSLLNLPAYSGFSKLGVVQPSPDGPTRACRPCDRRRRGTLLGEGAGLFLLSSMRHAVQNDLEFSVEVVGAASTLDGGHITAPDRTGAGMRRAMQHALDQAGVSPSEVDYVNLHGTGTRLNDPVELKALTEVVGTAAPSVMVSSTKDRHGHLIAAAGIMEALIVYLSMVHGLVPYTANLRDPVPQAGKLDMVMGSHRRVELRTCMSNSFAFGGVNTSVVFQRVEA